MEQNTDRMYWTVGIIVLGAIIIAGASYFFPDLVGEIGDKIKDTLSNPPAPKAPATPQGIA